MLEVRDEHRALRRATEDAGRVKRRHDRPPNGREFHTVGVHHSEATPPGHSPDGRQAKRHDDGPGVGFNVENESSPTGIDRLDQRVDWVRHTGDRVGDEEVGLGDPSLGERLRQHVARWPDKRTARLDLVLAGRLADEDDAARGVAPRPDSGAELAVRTAGAVVDGRHGASVAPPRARHQCGGCGLPCSSGRWPKQLHHLSVRRVGLRPSIPEPLPRDRHGGDAMVARVAVGLVRRGGNPRDMPVEPEQTPQEEADADRSVLPQRHCVMKVSHLPADRRGRIARVREPEFSGAGPDNARWPVQERYLKVRTACALGRGPRWPTGAAASTSTSGLRSLSRGPRCKAGRRSCRPVLHAISGHRGG